MSTAAFTRNIIGIPATRATDAGLSLQHAENPLFQCRFRWDRDAIAFWDNRCASTGDVDYWPHTPCRYACDGEGERPV